jgi:hypothetical protein
LASAGLLAGPALAAQRWAGRPLAEALRALQSEGLTLVFTSELVRPDMRVEHEPSSQEPRRLLDEILAPHGLKVQEAAGGVLVVVAAPGARLATIAGTVRARGSTEGLAGAVVHVVELGRDVAVGSDGAFAIAELEPGAYSLVASAEGFLDLHAFGVAVRPAASLQVELRLEPQPFFAEEIVVRSSRLTFLSERPEASFSLGREEIESLPHLGDDVTRATSLLPGTAANDVTAQLSVHGGRRDEVGVFLDGQELYDAYHLKDYDNALSLVAARTLSGASLTTGAFPASQGDRMSGVLDLRTLEPGPGRRTLLGLSVLDAMAASSGTFSDGKGGWLLTGRRGSLALATRAVGDEKASFWDALGKLELDTSAGSLAARLLAAGDELEVAKEEEESFERLENDYRNTYGWLTHQSIGRRLLVGTTASWARIERDRGGSGSEEEGGHELVDRRDLDVLGLSQSWDLQLGAGHAPQWGWELRRYDADFAYAKVLAPEIVVVAPFAAPRLTEHRFDGALSGEHVGLWASDRVALGRLTAELGARWDRHSASDDTWVSPRVNLAWRLGERSVVRGGWGRFVQSQRPYELQVEDGESALFPAERSRHQVVGFESLPAANRLGLSAVRLELFHREIPDPRPRYENLLEPLNFFPEIEPDRVRIAGERAKASGVELLLRGRLGTRSEWWIAYSYARARDRLAGEWVPRALDQPHTLAVDWNQRLPRNWSLNLAWRHHSGWPTTPVFAQRVPDPEDPEEDDLVAVFGALRSERLPAYHRLDLRASRRWEVGRVRRSRLTFFVDVQNLYNRENLAGFDVKPDEEAGTIELEPESWPGIVPSFGITWEL